MTVTVALLSCECPEPHVFDGPDAVAAAVAHLAAQGTPWGTGTVTS